MKKLILMLTIVAAVATTATAQSKNGKGMKPAAERAAKRTEMMVKKLKLNEEQKAQIGEQNLATATKVDEIRAKYAAEANKKGMGKELKTVKAERDAKYKSILTPEQFKAYQAAKEQMKDKAEEPDAK